jgi:hypothetical protein
MFSAIALMAFSVSSMGSTLENNFSLVLSDVCDSIAHDTYYMWYGNGFLDKFARMKANEATAASRKKLKNPKEISH